MTKIKLSDLIDALQFQSEEYHSFIDLRNNTVCIISDIAISYAEDNDDDYPKWQHEEVQLAKAYLDNCDNFIELPSQYDVNEYSMMEDFAFDLENDRNKELLFIALRGKGAFRRFKDTVNLLGLEDEWYRYRDEQYKQFILNWCDTEKIYDLDTSLDHNLSRNQLTSYAEI